METLGYGIVLHAKDLISGKLEGVFGKLKNLDSSNERLAVNFQRNTKKMMIGLGMVGGGLAALSMPWAFVKSTFATSAAIGELESLGVKDLKSLSNAAEDFSNTWEGTTKADFISASYDIKSGIASLSDVAVAEFTKVAALTGKATKSTTAEMTSLFATGYGIYKKMYSNLTDMEFGEMFSGGIAAAVQAFKTTGSQMSQAITTLGAEATSAKRPLEEQLAILGSLQAVMSGGEAGTKYRSFLQSAVGAQKELGLTFTDNNNQLLSATDIIGKLKGKYGESLDAIEKEAIKKAFGRKEAVAFIDYFYDKTDELTGSVSKMQKALLGGTALTLEMAEKMNMGIEAQFGLIGQRFQNLKEVLGEYLTPIFRPITVLISNFILGLQKAAKACPWLFKGALALVSALGMLLTVAGAIIAALGMFGMAVPAAKTGFILLKTHAMSAGLGISASFLPVTATILGIIAAVWLLKQAWESNFGGIKDFVLNWWNKISTVFSALKLLVANTQGRFASFSGESREKMLQLRSTLKQMGLWEFVFSVWQAYVKIKFFLKGFVSGFQMAVSSIRMVLEPAARFIIKIFTEVLSFAMKIAGKMGLVSLQASGISIAFSKISCGNFEKLGKILAVIVTGLGAIWALKKVILVIKGLVAVFKILQIGLSLCSASVWSFTAALLANPITWIIIGIVAIGAAIYLLIKHWDTVKEAFVSCFSTMVQWGKTAWEGISQFFSAIWGVVKNVFAHIRDAIYETFTTTKNNIFNFINGIFGSVGTMISNIWQSITDPKTFTKYIDKIIQSVVGMKDRFLGAGKKLILTMMEGIKTAGAWLYEALKGALGPLGKLLPHSDAKEGPLSQLTLSGRKIPETMASGVETGAAALKEKLRRSLPNPKLHVEQTHTIKTKTIQGQQKTKNIASGFGTISDCLTGPFKNIYNSLKTRLLEVGNMALSEMIQKLKKGAVAGLNKIIPGIDGAAMADFVKKSFLNTDIGEGMAKLYRQLGKYDLKEAVSKIFHGVKNLIVNFDFSAAWALFSSKFFQGISSLQLGIANLWGSVAGTIFGLWKTIKQQIHELDLFESGKKLLETLISGIVSKIGNLKETMKGALGEVRNLLPFSDAKEGPLSQLTLSGRKIPETMAIGVRANEGVLSREMKKELEIPKADASQKIQFNPLFNMGGLKSALGGLAFSVLLTPTLANNVPTPSLEPAYLPVNENRLFTSKEELPCAPAIAPVFVTPTTKAEKNERVRLLERVKMEHHASPHSLSAETSNSDLLAKMDRLIALIESMARPAPQVESQVRLFLDGRELYNSIERVRKSKRVQRYGDLDD